MVSPIKKVAMVWTAVIYVAITFIIVYFLLPFIFRASPNLPLALGACGLVLIIKFWSLLSVE